MRSMHSSWSIKQSPISIDSELAVISLKYCNQLVWVTQYLDCREPAGKLATRRRQIGAHKHALSTDNRDLNAEWVLKTQGPPILERRALCIRQPERLPCRLRVRRVKPQPPPPHIKLLLFLFGFLFGFFLSSHRHLLLGFRGWAFSLRLKT